MENILSSNFDRLHKVLVLDFESSNIQTQNFAPIQCTVWRGNVAQNQVFLIVSWAAILSCGAVRKSRSLSFAFGYKESSIVLEN